MKGETMFAGLSNWFNRSVASATSYTTQHFNITNPTISKTFAAAATRFSHFVAGCSSVVTQGTRDLFNGKLLTSPYAQGLGFGLFAVATAFLTVNYFRTKRDAQQRDSGQQSGEAAAAVSKLSDKTVTTVQDSVRVDFTSSVSVEDLNKAYVHLQLVPLSPTMAQHRAVHIVDVFDISASMGHNDVYSGYSQISRIQSLKDAYLKFLQGAPSIYAITLLAFDDRVDELCRDSSPQSLLQSGQVQLLGARGGTEILLAYREIDSVVATFNDNLPVIVRFFTDGGDDISRISNNIGPYQENLKKRGVVFKAVGISMNHSIQVLNRLICDARNQAIRGWTYEYITGRDPGHEYNFSMGNRTFEQIFSSTETLSASVALSDIKLTLGTKSKMYGGGAAKASGMTRWIGSGNTGGIKRLFDVTGLSADRRLYYRIEAKAANGQPVTINGSYVVASEQNSSVVCEQFLYYVRPKIVEIFTLYSNDKGKRDQCLAIIEEIVRKEQLIQGDKSKISAEIARVQTLKGKIENRQDLDAQDQAMALFLKSTSFAGAGGSSSQASGIGSGRVLGAVNGRLYPSLGTLSYALLAVTTPIQRGLDEVFAGVHLNERTQVHGTRVVRAARDLGVHLPLGYSILDLSTGTIVEFPITEVNGDGSISGTFVGDSEVAAFEAKHKLKFNLVATPEHPITWPAATRKAAGVPDEATHFRWIYPAISYTPEFESDSPYYWDDGMTSPDKSAKLKGLQEAVSAELSLMARNMIEIGAFMYTAEGYYRISDPQHQPVYALVDGVWTNRKTGEKCPDAQSSEFVQKTVQIRVISGNQVLPGQMLPLGNMVNVPDAVHNQLKLWSEDHTNPYLCDITLGVLLEQGKTKFKWLNPGDANITATYGVGNPIGADGAFVYYSPFEDISSQMWPCVSPDQATAHLHGVYSITKKVDGNPDGEQVLYHQGVDPVTKTAKTHAEKLLKDHITMDFKLAQLNIDCRRRDWLTESFFNNSQFVSEKEAITREIRATFELDIHNIQADQMAFVYPIYGKDLAISFQERDLADALFARIGANGHMADGDVLWGAFNIGSFAFYNKGQLVAVFAFVQSNSSNASMTLSGQLDLSGAGGQGLYQEFQKTNARQQSMIKILPSFEQRENVSKVTLFPEIATDFQYKKGRFNYYYESEQGATYYSYILPAMGGQYGKE